MDGVPRLPMLKVNMKEMQEYASADWMDGNEESLQESIKEEINKHIRSHYSDDPNKYKDCLSNFIELQSSAHRVMTAPDMEGCNTLKKYYGQLHYMQSRFPFVGDDALDVGFAWNDAFTGNYTQHSSFVFEQTAILFNLGAIHSFLGALDTRMSDDGTKISCVHFQCAAGFFQYLADHLDTTLSPDISQFMLKLYINTMLGQGQECLLEKSMQDNRKNSIVSKICQQVVDYYQMSLSSLNQSEARQAMGDANKLWHKLLSFKVAFYSAIVKYYLGNDEWDQEKYGLGLAYFQSAKDSYNEGVKLAKSLKGDFKAKADDALSYSADVFSGRFNSAKKDNEFIYHEKMPDTATLLGTKGASLVKALPFDPSNAAITGPDIFSKLVPLEAHLTASTYSEEKAKLLRPIIAEVEEKDGVLEQYKRAIELDPDKLIKVDDEDKLDPLLVEHCASLSVDQTPIQELTKAIKELSDVYMDIDTLVNDTISVIEQEENETNQVKDVCGKTVDSSDEVGKIKKELEVIKEVHEKAAQMNDDLHTAMKVHISNLKIVSSGLSDLKKECNFASISELITDEDREVIALVGKLCSKVTEMEVQRQSLVAQLRSQLEEDDVTSALMTNPGIDAEDLFQEQLKKHDTLVGYINQNLSAQENILNAVTEANVRYAKIKKVVDTHKQKVKSKCDNFLHSCTEYTEAVKRCREGILFFQELHDKAKETSEKMVKLNEKNIKLRKIIIDKFEVKKPPPRPTAPKPKSMPAKPVPGASMFSSEELAAMAAEDLDDFNDPAFLNYLKMSGGLPGGMSLPSGLDHSAAPRLNLGTSYARPSSQLSASVNPHAPSPNMARVPGQNYSTAQPHSIASSQQPPMISDKPHIPGSPSLQPQFTTLGHQPIMTSHHVPLGNQPVPPSANQAPPTSQPVPQQWQRLPPSSQPTQQSPHLPRQAPYSSHQPLPNSQQGPPMLPQGPHPSQLAPHPSQQVPPMSQQASYSSQQAPHPSQQAPHLSQQVPPLSQQASHSSQQASHPSQHSPHPSQQAPHPSQQAPHPSQQAPYLSQQAPHPSQQAPNPSQQAPHPSQQAAHLPRQVSHSYQQAPQSQSGSNIAAHNAQSLQHPQYQSNQQHLPSQPQSHHAPYQPSTHTGYTSVASVPGTQNQPPVNQASSQPQMHSNTAHKAPHSIGGHSQPTNYPHANMHQNPSQPMQQGSPATFYRAQAPHSYSQPGPPTSGPVQQVSQPQNFTQAVPTRPHTPQQQHNFNQPGPQTPQNMSLQGPQPSQLVSNQVSQPHIGYNQSNLAHGQPRHPSQTYDNQIPGQAPGQTPQNYQKQAHMSQQSAVLGHPPAQGMQHRPQSPKPQAQFQQQQTIARNQPPSQYQNFQQPRAPAQMLHSQSQQQIPGRLPAPATGQVMAGQRPPHSQSVPTQQIQRFAPNQPGPTRPLQPTNQQPLSQAGPQHQPPYHQQPITPQQQSTFNRPSVQPQNQQVASAVRHPGPTHPGQPGYPAQQQPTAAPHFQPPSNANYSGYVQGQTPVPQNSNMTPQNTPVPQQTPQSMPPPITPTAVGGSSNLAPPLEPTKPSADLEGLTYIPTGEVLVPAAVNTADELLTGSPVSETNIAPQQKTLLVPTKVDGEEMVVTRIEGLPYESEADLMKFKGESEMLQKRISQLLIKKPGTLCQLDLDWKQLSELQEKSARQQSTAVGRCSSYKNRFQDILPFDQNRVVLNEGKDDYINASLVDDINKFCPRFIATQSPLPSSCGDFWAMVHEQQVTLIVMLVGNNEIPKKCAKYWPEDRNVPLKCGAISITFTTSRVHESYIERTFTLKHAKSSLPRSLTQLQYTAWPEHGQPSSLHDLLSFMDVVHNFHNQQRSLQWPVVVHCENGVGHTGTFCSAYACIKYVDSGMGIPDVLGIVDKMRMKRKYMLQEKAQLKLVHDLVSIRAIELLQQRGVSVNQNPVNQPANKVLSPPPASNNTFDVFGSSALSSIQASVNKLTVKSPSSSQHQMPVSSVAPNPSSAPIRADINSLIGNNVSDLVQGTMPSQKPPDAVSPSVKPDVISDCRESTTPAAPLTQFTNNSVNNAGGVASLNYQMPSNPTALGSFPPNINSHQPPGSFPPHINPQQQPPNNNSLLEQLTPESFTLGSELKEKKRITKADFFRPKAEIAKDASDPFSDLDPMWTLKK